MSVRFYSTAPTHLLPALAAVLAAAALLTALEIRAGSRLKRFGPALASLNLPEAARGTVLQRQIFALPDCLPIYGSSELGVDQPTRADRFFRRKPYGFDAFVCGQPGDRCLEMSQELAALGRMARGRKVAVFLSPVWFLPAPESERRSHEAHKQFAALFSPVQAGLLAVDSPLRRTLKRRIAARLLDYDQIIRERSPLLAMTLGDLRDASWSRRCLFTALAPLVEIQNQAMVLQERCHWSEVTRDRALLHRARTPYSSRRKRLEWNQLESDMDHMETKRDLSALYSRGVDPETLPELPRAHRTRVSQDQDAEFLRRMNASPEWTDLGLLLGVARDLGVRLLLVGQPINGLASDDSGITPQARREYYRRLSQTAAAYHVPLRDFSAFEEDRGFFMDLVHPSAEAWVHYDEALAQFFRPARR